VTSAGLSFFNRVASCADVGASAAAAAPPHPYAKGAAALGGCVLGGATGYSGPIQ